MAGEIHGIIGREDAWKMWQPYGNRVSLDGSLDPAQLSNEDARQIVLGSHDDDSDAMWSYWYDEADDRAWYEGVLDVDLDSEPELVDLLVASHYRQQHTVEQRRIKSYENGLSLVNRLGDAALQLSREGIFTSSQVDAIASWLIGPDGLPFMQYTPMTQLEYARLTRQYDNEEADPNGTDCTDFNFGILRSAHRLGRSPVHILHNRVHEYVHGSLSGTEIYDITRQDEWRRPEATVLGVFACEPTIEIVAGDDFSQVENVELNEGWTDYLARELIRVDPGLGRPLGKARGYGEWAKTMQDIRANSSNLFSIITEAVLAEATPENPEAKRQAIVELHTSADRQIGTKDALKKLFLDNGGSILDIYTRGKKATDE